ncbi:hypothetical protein RR48_02479 [Papilio machaon]|uniref:Uncharacterized protein n=1 Tax=Papilio machaon TaxID=76193 RepID=A0A0N1IP36_PAPMA|nr:hypothetical protein RR48_02479 [Papilio machaon]
MSGGGAGLMSCVREGSLEPPYRPPQHTSNGEGRTGRFLRGLRRMFRRRSAARTPHPDPDPKSSSTSELLDAEKHTRRKEGAYGSGLSVSHDSVFTGERSGDESGDERPGALGIAQVAASHRAELVAAVRRRGRGEYSDDEEDLGLPRSPPASPPTDKADKVCQNCRVLMKMQFLFLIHQICNKCYSAIYDCQNVTIVSLTHIC